MIEHPIPPVYDGDSRILILGSFPSVKSREVLFFYGHPQNRFWPLLAALLKEPLPSSAEEKKALLLRRHIALWDVIARCEIEGSSDSSIRDAVPNDLAPILAAAPIRAIFCNGGTSYRLYEQYLLGRTGREAQKLPSTSPANAGWSMARLQDSWRAILPFLD
jgi:hypoxanthine-DNA glycosylase